VSNASVKSVSGAQGAGQATVFVFQKDVAQAKPPHGSSR
jgi:hypothetical protein